MNRSKHPSNPQQTKARSWAAVAMHARAGGGGHGGGKRNERRRDRQNIKRQLKEAY